MRIGLILTLAACWLPYGLIHRGQLQVNPKAEAVVTTALLGPSCSPQRWQNCR